MHNSTPSVRIPNQPPIEVVPPLPRVLTCAHVVCRRAQTHTLYTHSFHVLAHPFQSQVRVTLRSHCLFPSFEPVRETPETPVCNGLYKHRASPRSQRRASTRTPDSSPRLDAHFANDVCKIGEDPRAARRYPPSTTSTKSPLPRPLEPHQPPLDLYPKYVYIRHIRAPLLDPPRNL